MAVPSHLLFHLGCLIYNSQSAYLEEIDIKFSPQSINRPLGFCYLFGPHNQGFVKFPSRVIILIFYLCLAFPYSLVVKTLKNIRSRSIVENWFNLELSVAKFPRTHLEIGILPPELQKYRILYRRILK
jgi:hypothetical protein